MATASADRALGRLVLMCTLLLVFPQRGKTQYTSAGQARTPEEFDAYLLVLSKTSPKEVILAASEFEQNWPHSELLAHVFELQLEGYRSLGDSARAILAGENALKVAPDNLVVLAKLGYIIAGSTTEPQQLARAEAYARRELEVSKTIRIPKWISPAEWDEIQGHLGSIAHATLGLISYKRGETAGAIREFEIAVKLAPVPDPAQIYRLGMLYKASGNVSAAVELVSRAAESNDPTIRELAQQELKSLRH